MEYGEILKEFEARGYFPWEAVLEARANRETLTPRFLALVEGYVAGDPDARAKPDAVFFIFHLFGEWKVTAAYRPFARLLRLPYNILGPALGDATTETARRVMASVYDGDPEPLQSIVLDPQADEAVRSGACETLAILVQEGELDRDGCLRFLERCFTDIQPQATCYVWDGWAQAIAMLHARNLKPLAKTAYDREFIDVTWGDYE
jgi:hypothetical protein